MKKNYLFVVPSSSQMYSGTGTAIFDWINYASGAFNFSILMDTDNFENFSITYKFCQDNNIEILPSKPFWMPGCVDSGIKDIGAHIVRGKFDIIECVSWANAAANMFVLKNLLFSQLLIYTPHTQPTWTLSHPDRFRMLTPVFESMLLRSDAVFLDSKAELALLPNIKSSVHVVPLGVDSVRFKNLLNHDPKIVLCICDCREHRKRVDLLLAAFKVAYIIDPQLRLILAGKGSDILVIDPEISGAVTALGYVAAETIVSLYNAAGTFALMSDFEAFGLPIAEALCCGCSVLLNDQSNMRCLFNGMAGVVWTNNINERRTAELILELASKTVDSSNISSVAAEKFSFYNTYGQKIRIINEIFQRKAIVSQ